MLAVIRSVVIVAAVVLVLAALVKVNINAANAVFAR